MKNNDEYIVNDLKKTNLKNFLKRENFSLFLLKNFLK